MHNRVKSVLSIVDSISEWGAKSVSFLVVIASVLVIGEIVMRYAFNSPTVWGTELVTYFCMILYIMGGGYVLSLDMHVKVDVIYGRFGPRIRAVIDIATAPFFFLFTGVILWFSVDWMWGSMLKGQTTGTQWDLLVFPIKLILPLATFLLLLQGLAKFTRDLHTAIRSPKSEH